MTPQGHITGFVPQMRRYVLVGAIATAVDWIVFSLLVFWAEWHYLLAGVVSFIIATFAGYWSGLMLVFRSGRHRRSVEIALVFLVSSFGLVIHAAVLVVVAEWLLLHLFLAKVAATAATFLWNFAARFFWIFERAPS